MALLSSCAKTNYNVVHNLDLSDMPIAGSKVANELDIHCDENKCPNIIAWLNELYLFRLQYSEYKTCKVNC
tara:strand:- start:584 stop:796 length:213 start_codon:yes stop_codon:yes gene_type:complete